MKSLTPTTLQEAQDFATVIAQSHFIPKEYCGNPGNVLAAVLMGAELGLKPLQALQNIAVINGRPSIWGDAMKALVMSSGQCEAFEETFDEQTLTATCKIIRTGYEKPFEAKFSARDAEQAKLWGKQGPWTQYPTRMLQLRARAFACRDAFPDRLKGLAVAEESQDIEEQAPEVKDVTPVKDANENSGVKTLKVMTGGHEAEVVSPVSQLLGRLDQATTIDECREVYSAMQVFPRESSDRKLLSKALKAKRLKLEAELNPEP